MERRFSILNAPFDIIRIIISLLFFYYLSIDICFYVIFGLALNFNYIEEIAFGLDLIHNDRLINVMILTFSLSILLTIGFYFTIGGKLPIYREEKKIDSTTVILLYILSFVIPLAGFIVGAIYATKEDEHYKFVGKNCLLFSLMNIVLGLVIVATVLDII